MTIDRRLSRDFEQQGNSFGLYSNELEQTKLFVLLDNLGLPAPLVPCYRNQTQDIYARFVDIETRILADRGGVFPNFPFLGRPRSCQNTTSSFNDDTAFSQLGVSTLRVEPSVIDTRGDDSIGNIEFPLVQRWAMILQAFALEWLDMVSQPQLFPISLDYVAATILGAHNGLLTGHVLQMEVWPDEN